MLKRPLVIGAWDSHSQRVGYQRELEVGLAGEIPGEHSPQRDTVVHEPPIIESKESILL